MCDLMPGLMHVQVLGLDFNSRINSFSEFKYFDFHTHAVLKWRPCVLQPAAPTGPQEGMQRDWP